MNNNSFFENGYACMQQAPPLPFALVKKEMICMWDKKLNRNKPSEKTMSREKN